MKIVLISPSPPFRGGISTHSACIYQELSKNNSVLVINYNKLYPNFLFPGKTQYNREPTSLDIPSERIINSINPLSWKKAANRINSFNPDLVLFRYWNPFFCICLSSISKQISKNIRKVALCDNIIPHEQHFFDIKLIKYFFKNMDGFIVQSTIVEKELIKLNPRANFVKLFHPIYNYLEPSLDKIVAKNYLNIKNSYIALFFGLIRDYKGFDVFIETAKILNEKGMDIKFLAVGECYSNKEKYTKLIDKYNLGNIILWIDDYVQDDDINMYFSASDFVVLPYKTASQSGIISLAYNYNKPVITTDLEGLKDYIVPNKTGFICKVNNPVDISENITKIINNNNLDKMSNFIHDYKNRFSWKEFCHGIESFYNQL